MPLLLVLRLLARSGDVVMVCSPLEEVVVAISGGWKGSKGAPSLFRVATSSYFRQILQIHNQKRFTASQPSNLNMAQSKPCSGSSADEEHHQETGEPPSRSSQSSSSSTLLSVNRAKGNANRRIIPLTRPINSNSNPDNNFTTRDPVLQESFPSVSSSTPIALESVLIDLQKLQSPRQSKVCPSVQPARRVHFFEEQVGGYDLKEVSVFLIYIWYKCPLALPSCAHGVSRSHTMHCVLLS